MRRKKPKKRYILPDPRYKEVLVTKFVNSLMESGKKQLAYSIFYSAMDLVEEKIPKEDEESELKQDTSLDIFKRALDNISPSVEVKSKRIGGANFQVPLEVRPERKMALSIKWLIKFARGRHERTMQERLALEILAASKGEGTAVKKKDDTHRMAEANKAFSRFRF